MFKKIKAPSVLKNIFSIILVIVGVIPFYLNPHASTEHIYGGQLFHTDITQMVMSGYFLLLSYILLIIAILFFAYYLLKRSSLNIIFLNNIEINNKNILINSILIFFISFFFKIILYDFDLEFSDASIMINNYYEGIIFDVYKLYTFIAVLASYMFVEYNFALALFNIFLGSLTISIFSLILFKANQSFLLNNIIIFLVILYLPLTAIDSLIRTDTLYLFLFTSSIYLTLRLAEKNNLKTTIYLNIILFLSCLAREQTIYLLPLYLIFILISKINNKRLIIVSLIFSVITTSFLVSSYNQDKYGMSSLFKNRLLIISSMQYGYFNSDIMNSYSEGLSDNAKLLSKDIEGSYIKNILPSKREEFINSKLPSFWSYIRPDYYNIYDKNNILKIVSRNEFLSIRNELIKTLEIDYKFLSLNDFNKIIIKSKDNKNYRDLLNIQSIFINDFYGDGTNLSIHKKNTPECLTASKLRINTQCMIQVIKDISYDYYKKRHDVTYYDKAALEIASHYEDESKSYIRHKHVSYISEIVLANPVLYITQSLLSLTTMTGYVPIPTSISSSFNNIYTSNKLPNVLLYDLQKLYYFPINFWYIYCFLLMLYILLFYKKNETRNIYLFLSFIPIYYGLFLSFATFSEFARLMLPVIPLIIFSYIKLYQKAPISMSLTIILSYFFLNILY